MRLVVVAVSLLACAWFALGVRQARDTDRATSLIGRHGTPTPALTDQILSLLHTAGRLNPDHTVDELRAQAEIRAGQPELALRQMERLARLQPQDVNVWIVLGFAAGDRAPALASRAQAQRRLLAPPVRTA